MSGKIVCVLSGIDEVLSFPFSQEEEKDVKKLLSKFIIIDINQSISNQAIQNRKIKKIKLPDNLVASTAMVNGLILVTRNIKDFQKLEVEVLNPFE